MVRAALAALTLAAALSAAAAPDPCCLRVTPYHIQALAQRMAQRFQALEYRAQDLRYVFASFQAVHGNVSHRLRYLEAEHAHLSQLVGRLDARVQALEADKRMEQHRQQMAYYSRGPRHSPGRTPVDDLMKALRRRRNENQTELPHLFVHLDQSKESFEADGSISFTKETTSSTNTAENHPSPTEISLQRSTPAPELVHQNPNVHSGEATVSADSDQRPTPHTPILLHAVSEPPPQLSDSVTTPTPLWQLEETASALLNVMSAGDDDADVPTDNTDGAVSYWSPANETDSLEELFNPLHRGPAPGTAKCTGQTNCSEEKSELQSSGGASNISTSTDATVSDSGLTNSANSSSDSGLFQHGAVTLPDMTLASGNGSVNATSERESAEVATIKTGGCKTPDSALPVGEIPVQSDNATNLTRLLLDTGNDTSPLSDLLFSPGGASLPPDGGGGAGGGSAELSDAELQAALRELDALLQRPPPPPSASGAQPPDPEKALLKRALTLALAALDRTSDACLKLVNFTADAFEGMAATEA